ncbi:hypothetical protein NB2BOR_A39130 [Bordetella parapertussis]|nr:hypothetical protein NB2BOR_A39130 [Bordetella parapertussis]
MTRVLVMRVTVDAGRPVRATNSLLLSHWSRDENDARTDSALANGATVGRRLWAAGAGSGNRESMPFVKRTYQTNIH